MQVAIMGAGFVGVATAVACAEDDHPVTLIEKDDERRRQLKAGRIPFHEDGLDKEYRRLTAAGRIEVSDVLKSSFRPQVVYITVGTPQGEDGFADLTQVEGAARETGRFIRSIDDYVVVAVKSTVPPGTTQQVVQVGIEEEADGAPFGLVASPEFLREGSALQDARHPSRIVIGATDERSARVMQELHRNSSSPLLIMAPKAAELVKYTSNAFLAMKIAFANETGNLAERLGLDIDEVMAAVGMDPRIGDRFLQAGLGFGGSCFPKDVAALRSLSQKVGTDTLLLDAALEQNRRQPLRAVESLREAVGELEGKRVALLGLAFKPGTSDVRETRAALIHDTLQDAGAEVVCYDPVAGPAFSSSTRRSVQLAESAEEALAGAHAAVIQTAWPEFRALDPETLGRLMRRSVVIDGRRVLDPAACARAGIEHRPIGNGTGRYNESRDPSSRPRNEIPTRDQERSQGNASSVGPPRHPIRG